MLCLCVKLLEENKDIASFYQNLCEYVIEDEAQDSSVIQQKLLEILSAKHKNLIRCGDINQAITTTFTNADIDGFRNYVLHSQNVTMDYSQRCSKNVYELANSLVDYAKESPVLKDAFFDIKMRAVDGKNPVVDNGVESDLFEDYKEERAYLLETIRNIFRHEKNASVAILVRNNYQIEDYSSFLADYGYEVITKSDCLIMQPVFALIFALLKFCAHPWQNENVLNFALVLKEQKLVNFTQNDIDYLKELKSPFILQQEDCLPDGALSGFLWDLNYWLESSDLSVDEQALKAGMYYYTSEIEKSNIFIIALLLKRFYSQYKNMDLFLERLQELAPEIRWHTLCTPEEQGYVNRSFTRADAGEKRTRMVRFLASMEILKGASLFVGSVTPGPSLYLSKLLYPRICPADCRLEDFPTVCRLPIAGRTRWADNYLHTEYFGEKGACFSI